MHIKNIILWRHADAQIVITDQIDSARALTPKGKIQARQMAKWLKKQVSKHTVVLSSSAVRAIETCEFLNHKVVVLPQLLPEATGEDVMQVLSDYGTEETVVIVGHQPWLGQLAAKLLGVNEHEFAIKKGAVWWLRLGSREVSQYQLYCIQTPQLMD
jgi:phosphohistidine phosphatase